jgi:hypothetical protein
MPGSGIFFCGKRDAPKLYLAVLLDAYTFRSIRQQLGDCLPGI